MIPLRRLALVEDDPAYSRRLAAAFDATPGWGCVAVCRSAAAALRDLPALRPDVVLVDINLPDQPGDRLAAGLHAALPAARLVMLTVVSDDGAVARALLGGAVGYLLKEADWPEILEAVEDALAGGSPLSPPVARRLLERWRALERPSEVPVLLSPREIELLQLSADGLTDREIAARIGRSRYTPRAHFRHILEKLQARSRAHAVAVAARHGLLR